jgi:hypothetical protein
MKKLILFSILTVAIGFVACKKKDANPQNEFDKASLLKQVSDEIIVPRFSSLQNQLSELVTKWGTFKANPTSINLSNVKSSWLNANVMFQQCKVFNFGPALDHGLRSSFGTFPTDTSKILANSTNSSTDLNSLSNLDAVGFPALEFLFYRSNALNTLATDQNIVQYIDAVLLKMETEISAVLYAWNSGYSASFKNSTGTEVTSGFSLLINAFNQDFELAKNAKLGIPIGKQSLGIPQLEYQEAPFSKRSVTLLTENLIGLRFLFAGDGHNGITGIGFDDYLIALEKNNIENQIQDRFNYSFSQLSTLGPDLEYALLNSPSVLDDLYVNLQAMVVHLKTDMTGAFGVLITYQDNDGD